MKRWVPGVSLRRLSAYAALAAGLIWTVVPIAWLLSSSLKTRLELFSTPSTWLPRSPTVENYAQAFVERPYLQYMANSAVVAVGATLISVVIGSLTGYALVRFRYPGRFAHHFSFWILSTRMLPPIVTVLPLYVFFSVVHMIDTRTALVVAYTGVNLPFVVWMMRSYFAEIPRELEESAMVDGDTRMGAFLRVTLPLARPGLVATAIFCFILAWNELLLALILTETTAANTLPVGIAGRITQYRVEWGELCASAIVSLLPIVAFAFLVQRHLVRGLSFGAVKG